MFRLFQAVAIVLLTAVLGFGNCGLCIATSITAGKAQQAQTSCHQSTAPEPEEQPDGCAAQTELLNSAQFVERVTVAPQFVALAAFDAALAIDATPKLMISGDSHSREVPQNSPPLVSLRI